MSQERRGRPTPESAAPAEGLRCGERGAHGACERPAGHADDHRAGDWSWQVIVGLVKSVVGTCPRCEWAAPDCTCGTLRAPPPGVPASRPRRPTRLTWPEVGLELGPRVRIGADGRREFSWRGRWRPYDRPIR